MINPSKTFTRILFIVVLAVLFIPHLEAQTKRLKRPNSRVGISSVDTFVGNSFDIYDKVYMYDGYAKSGTPLTDDDISVLEDALKDLEYLSESAPNVMGDINGAGLLKQGKATLQMNRSKKALKYSIKMTNDLLLNNTKGEDSEEEDRETETDDEADADDNDSAEGKEEGVEDSNVSDDLEVYSKFDFVPGDKLLYYDDFSLDFIGDFPSKWNTNGTGEIVKLNNVEGNWFEIKAGYYIYYIPLLDQELPEEYTIEFDLLTKGIDKSTSSTAVLEIVLDDNDGFKPGTNMAQASIPFCQYSDIDINIQNKKDNNREIYSNVGADIRKAILNQPHISIAVNKKRFRLWINERKYIDVPQLVPEHKLKYLKFGLNSLKDDKDRVFIRNLKIAEGGVDLRQTLMKEGRISTNGILFDSGSANIQPQSYGIINQISQVLRQDENINLNIIGHTDDDGDNDANLNLSKERAEAVKKVLTTVYNISGDRLQTEGKGEREPVADNSTTDGKAQNRRVEFVKM